MDPKNRDFLRVCAIAQNSGAYLTLTQTLTLIHRAIEAHVGPKVHFILVVLFEEIAEYCLLP